jgi:hypothetical protein
MWESGINSGQIIDMEIVGKHILIAKYYIYYS